MPFPPLIKLIIRYPKLPFCPFLPPPPFSRKLAWAKSDVTAIHAYDLSVILIPLSPTEPDGIKTRLFHYFRETRMVAKLMRSAEPGSSQHALALSPLRS